jgi:hypothetical protein
MMQKLVLCRVSQPVIVLSDDLWKIENRSMAVHIVRRDRMRLVFVLDHKVVCDHYAYRVSTAWQRWPHANFHNVPTK